MKNVNRIKELRREAGLTQGQVGKFLKIDQSMVAKLESGDRNLTTVQLSKLANLFACSESYILGEAEKGNITRLAFRVNDMDGDELEVVATVNKIATNLNMLKRIMEKEDEEQF